MFPRLEKLVINPWENNHNFDPRYRPRLWDIDNFVMILETLAKIKHLYLLGPIIHLTPGYKKSDEERVEILEEGLKIIHEKFPLESQFLIVDFISRHEIRKQQWKKAELNRGIDEHFEVDEIDYYDESDTEDEDEEESESEEVD